MIKILGNSNGKSKTPGYFLTSKGVIDCHLNYTGYIVCKYDRPSEIKEDDYLIIFDVDWQGELFNCITSTNNIILVNNQPRIDNQITYNLHHFTYQNHQHFFLKIPNNIYIMWHDNLIDKNNIMYSYFLIKLISLTELSLIIHNILLELLRNDYEHYKVIDNIITTEAKSIAKRVYKIDL
jgi:hypothetical protein